jgi:Interferon-induced transmembrane protein
MRCAGAARCGYGSVTPFLSAVSTVVRDTTIGDHRDRDAVFAATRTPRTTPAVHAGWAVAALLFFWPLSFSAFTHAFNVYPLWARGDVAGAVAASDRVRRLGQLSLWLAGGLFLLFLIGYALFILALIAYGGDGPHHFHHRFDD